MLDAEFLNGVFANEELTPEQRIDAIIAEHNADERGLLNKRDELLGSEKKLKEQIGAYEKSKVEYESKIAGLTAELEKNSPEQHKQYYESQLAIEREKFNKDLETVQGERDFFRNSHYEMLKKNAIEEGTKDLQFMDGLKEGFIAIVTSRNKFEPKEIDGQTIFLNASNKTIPEVMKEFASTTEGKAYIKNPTSGGNAHNNSNSYRQSAELTMTRSEFESRVAKGENLSDFFAKGGQVVDE